MLTTEIKDSIKNNRPYYIPDAIHTIFSWQELENLLNLRPFASTSRLTILSNETYSWRASDWSSDFNCYPPSLLNILLKEHVAYFRDATRVNKHVNEIAKDIEDLTGLTTDAHIYFALNTKGKSFGIHNDINDNMIVQIEGQTNFKVWDIKAEEDGPNNIDSLEKDPIIDVTMKPGDVIGIPRKYWHSAISQTPRMSISFAMSPCAVKQFEDRNWININSIKDEK
jgi:hypothetical protein